MALVREYETELRYQADGVSGTFVTKAFAYDVSDAFSQSVMALLAAYPTANVAKVLRIGPPQVLIDAAVQAREATSDDAFERLLTRVRQATREPFLGRTKANTSKKSSKKPSKPV